LGTLHDEHRGTEQGVRDAVPAAVHSRSRIQLDHGIRGDQVMNIVNFVSHNRLYLNSSVQKEVLVLPLFSAGTPTGMPNQSGQDVARSKRKDPAIQRIVQGINKYKAFEYITRSRMLWAELAHFGLSIVVHGSFYRTTGTGTGDEDAFED
jgi:hypothetical protein